jgi:hypothetical protein
MFIASPRTKHPVSSDGDRRMRNGGIVASPLDHLRRLLFRDPTMTVHRTVVILLVAVACVACSGRAGRANQYGHGTPLNVIVSELGPPDADRPYSDEHRRTDFCPAETTRLVDYLGPSVPFLIHGAATTLCVDKSNRVIKVLFSEF